MNNYIKKFKHSVLASSILLAGLAIAEEKKTTPPESEKTTIFVTANRGINQDPQKIPQVTSTITKEDISEKVYADVDDIVRQEANVNMAPAEGNPNFWQEGFSIRGLGAQRVLTLTDNVRQAGQGIGYGGGNLSLYDSFGIERIEIIKGPRSVIYGTDAIGGVINIITREPFRREHAGYDGGVKYEYDGSRDLNRVGTYLDAGDKNTSAVISGSIFNSGDANIPLNDPHSTSNGSNRGFSINSKFDFYIDDTSKIRVIGNFNDNRDIKVEDSAMVLPIAMFPPPGSTTNVFSPLYFNFPNYQRSLLGAEYISENDDCCFDYFKTGLYWQRIGREFHRETAYYSKGQPGFAGPPLFVDPTATVNRAVVDTDDTTDTFEWLTTGKTMLDDNNEVVVGAELGFDTTNQDEVETLSVAGVAGKGPVFGGQPLSTTPRQRVDAEQYRIGTYLQDTYTQGKFKVIPGVRFDYFNVQDARTTFDDNVFGVSGSIGTVYEVKKNNDLFFNVAHGFRAPDMGERFQNGIVNFGAPTRIIGGQDLDPEKSWSVETGFKSRSDSFNYYGSVFANRVNDYIGTTPIGMQEGFITDIYANLDDVTFYGGEAGINILPTDNSEVFANAGRTWTNKTELVDVPNWVFNYGLRYKFAVNQVGLKSIQPGLTFRTVLQSDDETPQSPGRPKFDGSSFTVANLLVNFDIGETSFGRGKVVTGIRNLFDKEYKEPFFNQFQPERNLYAGVEFHF